MTALQVQHSDYQQLASRIADLNEALKVMETQLHDSSSHLSDQPGEARQSGVVETPLAIAAG